MPAPNRRSRATVAWALSPGFSPPQAPRRRLSRHCWLGTWRTEPVPTLAKSRTALERPQACALTRGPGPPRRAPASVVRASSTAAGPTSALRCASSVRCSSVKSLRTSSSLPKLVLKWSTFPGGHGVSHAVTQPKAPDSVPLDGGDAAPAPPGFRQCGPDNCRPGVVRPQQGADVVRRRRQRHQTFRGPAPEHRPQRPHGPPDPSRGGGHHLPNIAGARCPEPVRPVGGNRAIWS